VRLVGYPRVSTRGQVKTGASIPYQDREIRAWARRNRHRIVGMFPEEGRSGALDLEDRAALTAAIDLIATGKAEGLVCYSLDRLAREITRPGGHPGQGVGGGRRAGVHHRPGRGPAG